MNTVFAAAAEANQLGWLLGLTSIFFFAMFLAFVIRWLLPGAAAEAKAAALLPLEEDPTP
jgi:hypothetical protein